MSPPPIFNISGQVLDVNVTGCVQVSGAVTVSGELGVNLSGCVGVRNCSGQVLAITGMSVTVNVYSNSGSTGVTSGEVVQIVSGMNLPYQLSGAPVVNSGWAISGDVANEYQHSGCYLPCSAADGFAASGLWMSSGAIWQTSGWAQASGAYALSGTGGGVWQVSGWAQASGVYALSGSMSASGCLTSSDVLTMVSGQGLYQFSGLATPVSGAYQLSGIYMVSGNLSGMVVGAGTANRIAIWMAANRIGDDVKFRIAAGQMTLGPGTQAAPIICYSGRTDAGIFNSGGITCIVRSGVVIDIPGTYQVSGVWAYSGATFMSGGSIYIANGAYGTYAIYASGLNISGHAFGIIYPGTYRMSIDGQYYQFHAPSTVTLSIIKNVTTLNTATQTCDNSATYSPTAQASCHALNFLQSGDVIDFQFSAVDHGQATINRVGD
jgi:hypothetical protein